MKYMDIEIYTKNIDLSRKEVRYIEKKINSLSKYLRGCEGQKKIELRVGKDTRHHKKGKIFFAEGRITTAKKNFGARAEGETFMEAMDQLKDEISKKIRRYTDKKQNLIKKSGKILKKLLRRQ